MVAKYRSHKKQEGQALPLNRKLRKQLSESFASAAYRDMIDALSKLRELPYWNDHDLPATTRLTEAIGMWAYRGQTEPVRRELLKARATIDDLKTHIREPIFKQYIEMRLKEIDKYLKAKKNDPGSGVI